METPEIEILAIKEWDDRQDKQKRQLATHSSLSLFFVVFF